MPTTRTRPTSTDPTSARPLRPTPRRAARGLRAALALALAAVALLAGPAADVAAADPAGPSDYRSEVTGIVPPTDGVEAEVLGGDSFLELRVAEGVTAVVLGYRGEPYLRFLPDGTVEENRNSQAVYLNEDRYGAVEIPEEATDPDAEPRWERVADDGVFAWHDHRIHWMSSASPAVERGERVGGAYDPWQVPVLVDGAEVQVQGTLTYAETGTPIPWFALAVVVAAGLAVSRRAHAVRIASVALVLASALAVVTGRAELSVSPPDSGVNPLLWILPAVALVAAVAAVVLGRRPFAVVAALASVAALAGWALLRLDVLLKPILPTELPYGLDRASVGLAFGVAAGAAYLAVTSGALALPALEDDDDTVER